MIESIRVTSSPIRLCFQRFESNERSAWTRPHKALFWERLEKWAEHQLLGDSRNGYEITDQSSTYAWDKDRGHHIEQPERKQMTQILTTSYTSEYLYIIFLVSDIAVGVDLPMRCRRISGLDWFFKARAPLPCEDDRLCRVLTWIVSTSGFESFRLWWPEYWDS